MKVGRWLENLNDQRPWTRSREDWITKSRYMNGHELQHMLLAQGGPITEEMRDSIYAELIQLRGSLSKAGGLWIAAFSLAFLSLYGIVESASFGGVSITRNSFLPVALIGMAVTSLWFATVFTKFSFLRSWFEQQAKLATPLRRAWLYLRYPEAFQYFAFARSNIGYPANVFPAGTDMRQLIPLLLVLIIATACALSSLFFQVVMMFDVWHSAYPNALISRAIVIFSTILNILGFLAPRPTILRRKYLHYGLSQQLDRADPKRLARAHSWIRIIRDRRWPEED